jgi:uncharacterized protein (UPF0335 family)
MEKTMEMVQAQFKAKSEAIERAEKEKKII